MFCHNMFTTPPPRSVTTPNQITFIPHVNANRVATKENLGTNRLYTWLYCMMAKYQLVILFCYRVSGWVRVVSGFSMTSRQIMNMYWWVWTKRMKWSIKWPSHSYAWRRSTVHSVEKTAQSALKTFTIQYWRIRTWQSMSLLLISISIPLTPHHRKEMAFCRTFSKIWDMLHQLFLVLQDSTNSYSPSLWTILELK